MPLFSVSPPASPASSSMSRTLLPPPISQAHHRPARRNNPNRDNRSHWRLSFQNPSPPSFASPLQGSSGNFDRRHDSGSSE